MRRQITRFWLPPPWITSVRDGLSLGEEPFWPLQWSESTPDILWMSRGEYHILLFYHPKLEPA
jgi:hypothetical protein